jgi:hypothetical protein
MKKTMKGIIFSKLSTIHLFVSSSKGPGMEMMRKHALPFVEFKARKATKNVFIYCKPKSEDK